MRTPIVVKYHGNYLPVGDGRDRARRRRADRQHEGHSGWRIDEITARLPGWLATYRPEILLVTIGTNDVVQDHRLSTAPDRLGALIDVITDVRPKATVFVASLPPLANAADDREVRMFNRAIPEIIRARVRAGHDVRFVAMYAALTSTDLADGVHPNTVGYAKMAARWTAAIRKTLRCRKATCNPSSCVRDR